MLRIEKESHGCVTHLLLSGRIQLDDIACIRSALDDCCTRKLLDLGEASRVDVAVVRLLIQCEDPGG